jgi:hypothetical protein
MPIKRLGVIFHSEGSRFEWFSVCEIVHDFPSVKVSTMKMSSHGQRKFLTNCILIFVYDLLCNLYSLLFIGYLTMVDQLHWLISNKCAVGMVKRMCEELEGITKKCSWFVSLYCLKFRLKYYENISMRTAWAPTETWIVYFPSLQRGSLPLEPTHSIILTYNPLSPVVTICIMCFN